MSAATSHTSGSALDSSAHTASPPGSRSLVSLGLGSLVQSETCPDRGSRGRCGRTLANLPHSLKQRFPDRREPHRMAADCCLHFLHQLEQWRQTPRPLKSQSQTGAGRLSHMGSQSGLATSGVLSPPEAPGYHRWEAQPRWLLREGSQKRGRVLPTSLSGDRGVGWREGGLSNQLPPKPAPGQGWEFHKKSKRAL